MLYLFLCHTVLASSFFFTIQKGNVIQKEEHDSMFCKNLSSTLPPQGELYASHFHVPDSWFSKNIIEEQGVFEAETQSQIDDLYKQVQKSQIISSAPIIKTSQWTSLLEIQANTEDLYISQYNPIAEPWEILVYSGGHKTEDGHISVPDTLSASILILRILAKDIPSKHLQLVRYSSKETTSQYAFGIFIKESITNKEEEQTVLTWGIETTKGIFFPVSKNILPSDSALQNAEFWSYEEGLDLAWDHTKKSHNKKIEIIEREEKEGTSKEHEEEHSKSVLPPIKIVRRPGRKSQSAGEFVYLFFILGGSLLFCSFYLRSYLKEQKKIREAIEERKKREQSEF
jgi:hypothetical protein